MNRKDPAGRRLQGYATKCREFQDTTRAIEGNGL